MDGDTEWTVSRRHSGTTDLPTAVNADLACAEEARHSIARVE
jgi:hypothetical protein